MHPKIIESGYDPVKGLLITRFKGLMNRGDVDSWVASLDKVFKNLAAGTEFKILVDMHGFEAVDFETHKQMRVVIPTALAGFGHMVGYVKQVGYTALNLYRTNGCYCSAAVHVHHDNFKMQLYEERFSSINEHFMSDPVRAEQWISNFHLQKQQRHGYFH